MTKMTSQDTIATVTVQNIPDLERRIKRAKHVNLDLSFERNRLGPTQEFKYTPTIIAIIDGKTVVYDCSKEEDPNFGYCRLRTLNKILGIADRVDGQVDLTINDMPYNKAKKVIRTQIKALYDKIHEEKNYSPGA